VGVTEFNDTGAAAAEMRRLWQWIDEKLEAKSQVKTAVLSGVVTPAPEPLEASHEPPIARRKAATIQETVYLQPAAHDQLRELAFEEG